MAASPEAQWKLFKANDKLRLVTREDVFYGVFVTRVKYGIILQNVIDYMGNSFNAVILFYYSDVLNARKFDANIDIMPQILEYSTDDDENTNNQVEIPYHTHLLYKAYQRRVAKSTTEDASINVHWDKRIAEQDNSIACRRKTLSALDTSDNFVEEKVFHVKMKKLKINLLLKKGDKLIIETKEKEIVYGKLVNFVSETIYLDKINAVTDKPIRGFTEFFPQPLVLNVYSFFSSMGDKLFVMKFESHIPCEVLISYEEYHRLLFMAHNNIVFNCKSTKYHKAICSIMQSTCIGLHGILSVSEDNITHLNLLVVTTWDESFTFDFSFFKPDKMFQEVREILEYKSIKKVVFDGNELLECLTKVYRLKIVNIYDIQEAEFEYSIKKNGYNFAKKKNIDECLNIYLHVPSVIFQKALNTDIQHWMLRPVRKCTSNKAALLAVFLITLKNFFSYHN